MRALKRNQSKLYYATYVKSEEIIDEYGNATGQYTREYSKPTLMYANISAARGTADTDMFGISLDYDKTIITDNISCPISETSILWVDTIPYLDEEGNATTPHDFIVKRVAKSLNSIAYAVSKVDVTLSMPEESEVPEEPDETEPPSNDDNEDEGE